MNIRYRPEIDGLRAISIISVLIYHAQLELFGSKMLTGGFIGVDIFFVISGYLITSIILKEILIKSTFSFSYFFERRVRRIIPVLLFVILISFPFFYFVLSPNSFINFSESINSSLFFISNFFFHYKTQVYATESSLLIPFLHTWSLSIEEQYYILFPIFLLIIFKYFRKYLLLFLFLGFVFSLLIAQLISKVHAEFAFYLLPTRLWELLMGSMLSYLEINRAYRSNNKNLNQYMTLIGFCLLIGSFIYFHDRMYHPSLITLLPIIGVSLIIWFSKKDELITKILSSKYFVKIGLISYSLYIWHYPIFAYSRIKGIMSTEIEKIFLIGITFILSTLTYFFIEKIFRDKKIKFRKILYILSAGIISIFIMTTYVIKNDGLENRSKLPVINIKELNFDKIELQSENNKGIKILFFGDSTIGFVWDYFVKQYGNKMTIYNFSKGDCILIFNYELEKLDKNFKYKKAPICAEKMKEALLTIKNSKNYYAVYGGMMPKVLSGKWFQDKNGYKHLDRITNSEIWLGRYKPVNPNAGSLEEAVVRTIKEISKNAKKTYLIYPFPELNFLPRQIITMKDLKKLNNLTISKDVYKKRIKETEKLYDSLTEKNIIKIKPENIICVFNNRCFSYANGRFIYLDDIHFGPDGTILLANEIIKDINLDNK